MKVQIKELTFKTIIGILPFERINKQRVILNISFHYDYDKNSKKFVDYSKVANYSKKFICKKKFELIEDAITQLKKELYKNFKIKKLKVKITKPDILKDCIVSVKG